MPVDLRQISFYPAQRQYIANDSQPSLELIQSGSGDYVVCRASGGGTPVFQITNAGVISGAAGIFEASTVRSIAGQDITFNANGASNSIFFQIDGDNKLTISPTAGISIAQGVNATTPAITLQNSFDSASNLVAVFSGADRATAVDDDSAYISYKLEDSSGNQAEAARMRWELNDVTSTTKDGRVVFSVMVNNTLTDVLDIQSSASGDITNTFGGNTVFNDNVSLLLGTSGADADFSSDGTDVKLLLKGGADFVIGRTGLPSPDNLLHLWEATAGSVSAVADSLLVLENNDNAYINVLAPTVGGIIFGDANNNDVGKITYTHSGNILNFTINGISQLNYANASSSTFAFQKNTTISSTGTLTIGAFSAGGAINFGNHNMTNVDINSGNIAGVTFNGTTTATADLTFNDNVQATFGTGGDADIGYNGADLVINTRVVGTGDIVTHSQLTWGTGVAVTAADYSIGRDADGTNQMHLNVPSGAGWEYSINDTAKLTYATGAFTFTEATTVSSSAGALTLNGAAGVVINESGADADFRIESNSNANALVLDANTFGGVGSLGLGSAVVNTAYIRIAPPALTSTANTSFSAVRISPVGVTVPTGTSPIVASLHIVEPVITATGTATTAATVYIQNAPTEGGANHALMVAAGSTSLAGSLTVTGGGSLTGTWSDLGTVTTVDIDGGTIDGVSIGASAAATSIVVDQLTLNDGTISTTASNNPIIITPHGTGDVNLSADAVRVGDQNANATITTWGTGDLILNTNAGTNSGSITIADGVDGDITVSTNGTGAISFSEKNITNVGNIALDSLTADGSTITITGNTTFADGAYNFNVASHDGSNGLQLGGTLVTATAAELNIIDGGTAATGTTLANADRVVVNDAGTMKQVALTDFETFMETSLDTLANVTTVGALDAGSISSGFGNIDTGSSNITTTGTVTTGDLVVNGTQTIVNSTTVTVDDPIFQVGGDSAPGSDDNKDRGIAFRWHNGSAAKNGFFGYDDSSGKFTFIPDATISGEVVSGTAGTVIATTFEGALTGTASNATTVDDNAITNVKLADMAANTIKVRNTNSSGDATDLPISDTHLVIGTGTGFISATLSGDVAMANTGAVTIANSAVTLSKMANLASMKLIGNVTGGAAAPAEVAILDEDNMTSDSAVALATQQSIKYYVDNNTTSSIAAATDTDLTSIADASLLFYDTGAAKWVDYVLSGDVTSTDAGVVTIGNNAIQTAMVHTDVLTGQTEISSGVDLTNDFLLLYDASASAYRKVNPGNMGITGLPAGSANEVQYRVSASAAGGAANVEIKNNSLALKEQSAPTNVSGYGMLYTTSSNELFFKDDGGNATQITNAGALAGGGAFKGTKLYLTNGTTSVANNSATTMTAWDESFDVGAMHAGTNGRITFGQVGYWNISIQQEWAADSSGYREMRVTHTDTSNSNATNIILRDRAIPSLQDTTVSGSSTVFYVDDVADYLTVQLYQNSGAALDAIGNNDDSTVVTVTRLDMATQGSGTASGGAGHVQLSDGSGGFSHDANAIFWDATNNRLGVNTGSPGYSIDATTTGTVRAQTYTGTIGTATQNSITTMTGLVSTGALAAGSIASGFGTISTGNTITTTAALTGGSLVVDDFTLDGTELDLSSGDFTVDVAGDITLNADGGDINFMDDSASLGTISSTGYSGNSATATTSTNVFAAADSTNANQYVAFLDNADANAQQVLYDTGITYNPNSNALTTTGPIQGSSVTSTGGLTLSGDITATGAAIDIDLIDNNASAISFDAAGLAGILAIVTTNGGEKVTMSGGLEIAGDLIVSGTTTTVNSTTTTVDDPVFTIGGDTAPSADDNKDRGIEFRYHTGSAAAIGFFGFDDSAGVFTGFTGATNTSEVFSGTVMPATFGNITGAAVTGTSFTIGSASIAEAELEMIDGITAGTAAASKALVLDSNKDIAGIRNITLDQDSNIVWSSGMTINDDSGNNAAYINLASGDALYLQDGGTTNMSIAASGAITMQAGSLTLGTGAEADYKLVFDGHSGGSDFYVGLHDSEDSLVLGMGSTVGSNGAIKVNSNIKTAIGGADPNANYLVTIGGAHTGVSNSFGVRIEPYITGVVNNNVSILNVAGTLLEAGSGTHANLWGSAFSVPTVTGSGATVTNTATVWISGAMSAGTNNYSLWVDDGLSRFDGQVSIGGATPSAFQADAQNLVVGTGTGHQGITIYTGNTSRGTMYFSDAANGTVSGGMNYDHNVNKLYFLSEGLARMIYSGGNNATLQLGLGQAYDAKMILSAQGDDWYLANDLTNGTFNNFVIGHGSTVGTTPYIRLLPSLDFAYGMILGGTTTSGGQSDTATGVAFMPHITSHSGDDVSISLVRIGGELAGQSMTTGGNTGIATSLHLSEPNITTSHTITNSATLYIKDAASEATNDYALWVDDGISKFDGHVYIDNYLQMSTANAGAANKIHVNNSHEDAGSDATIEVYVNGRNSSDAGILFATTYSTNVYWKLGIDQSNSKHFKISNNGTFGTNDYFTIDTSGNVGIGETSPSAKLEVAGQVKITGGSPGVDKILTSAADGTASWEESTAASTGKAIAMAIVF